MGANPANTSAPAPAPEAEQLPRHSASEQPVTRGYRVAFQVWQLCVVFTVLITILLFLFDKVYLYFTGR
jgi:hypothetical protein